jgi:hypothetical protein
MIMTDLLSCTCSGTCQADTTCHRTPRFQAHLDAAQHAQHLRVRRRTEACASHLVAMVAAMTTWAREQDLTDGDLTILTIDPPPAASHPAPQSHRGCAQTSGLVFSTIHIGA